MKELMEMVKDSIDRSVIFFLYSKVFRVSHIEETDDVWVDINEVGHSTKVRVRTVEDLVTYIRNHEPNTPVDDGMILFNVKVKVCKNLNLRCDFKD